MNYQLVTPNLDAVDVAGYCLRLQQKVWGAPARYATAWDAWEHVQQQTSTVPEDIMTLLWFDHWGTYGGVYGRYGHVVTYVPGRGLLSNPGKGVGQLWYKTIQECERDCKATYVGWSPDINGLQIAEITPQPNPRSKKDETKMMLCHKIQPDGSLVFLLFGDNFYLDFTGQEAANAFAGQIGSSSAPVSQSFFDKVKAEVEAGRK